MKIKLVYLAPFLALLMTGCLKKDNNNGPTYPIPSGNFSGTFQRVSRVGLSNNFDTVKASLQLSLSTTTGFQISGDTTLHAASFGGYALNQFYIQFVDESQPSAKYHLNGVYNYNYNGTQLNIYNDFGDTLSYQYLLMKTN